VRPPLERLLDLLPVHVVARDEEHGGLLRALLAAVGGELDLLERDIDELYASWFVETCPEWVVPYLADLVGVTDLPPDLTGAGGAGVSRRAFVANTVAYRRRKGTVAVVEQVARDVTGWPATVVEYHRRLAVATPLNHVHLERPASASLRTPPAAGGPLELVHPAVAHGALDPLAHTVDVRHIGRLRGRHGITNLGVFLFPDQVYGSGWAPARPPDGAATAGWSVDPLGRDVPLYAVPATEETIEHLASEADLAVPLRPRRLLALVRAARTAGSDPLALPVAVRVDGGDPLPAERLRVRGLEDLAPSPGWQVVVDAVAGRLHPYHDGGRATPERLEARFAYGGTADVGAGTYDRSATHADVLAADSFVGIPARGGRTVTRQVAVPAGPTDPTGPTGTPLAAALAAAEAAWAAGDPPQGGTYVISLGDSGHHIGDLSVQVPESTRLVLVAAAWNERVVGPGEVLPPVDGVYAPEGLRPLLQGTLTVAGGGGSSVVLDGVTVEGDVVVGPGLLGSLAVSQCTVTGRIAVGVGRGATNPGVRVSVVRSVTGGVAFGPAAATLEVRDSIVDAAGGQAVTGAGLALAVVASTVRGEVAVRTLEASSAILDGPVSAEHRQTGCLRYSFVPPTARAPRRYRCVPGPDDSPTVRPAYASVDPGAPRYLALAPGCPGSIADGGEDGSEMGVHHHLRRPVRLRAAARLLAPYVPVGLSIGVAAAVATRGQGS
jgi:hypothetical protein